MPGLKTYENGNILDVNSEFVEILGIESDELLGNNFLDYIIEFDNLPKDNMAEFKSGEHTVRLGDQIRMRCIVECV